MVGETVAQSTRGLPSAQVCHILKFIFTLRLLLSLEYNNISGAWMAVRVTCQLHKALSILTKNSTTFRLKSVERLVRFVCAFSYLPLSLRSRLLPYVRSSSVEPTIRIPIHSAKYIL